MKKILITAASVAVLTTGVAAHADHNYVGLGLGWTAVNAPGKQSTTPGGSINAQRKTSKDTSALSGTLILGRHFGSDLSGAFIEARAGKDSSNARSTYDITRGGTGQATLSLKRKFFINLGIGYSQNILPETNFYGKISLVLSKLQLRTTMNSTGIAGDGQGTAEKKRTMLGFAPTVGFSKMFSSDFFLSLDYTVEFYKKLSANGSITGINPEDTISAKVTPTYHTVMLGLTKKF